MLVERLIRVRIWFGTGLRARVKVRDKVRVRLKLRVEGWIEGLG